MEQSAHHETTPQLQHNLSCMVTTHCSSKNIESIKLLDLHHNTNTGEAKVNLDGSGHGSAQMYNPTLVYTFSQVTLCM